MIIFITCLILTIPVLSFLLKKDPEKDENKRVVIEITTILNDEIKHLIDKVEPEENSEYKKIESIVCKDPLKGLGIDPHNYTTKFSDRIKNSKS